MIQRMTLAAVVVIFSCCGLRAQNAERITVKGDEVERRVETLMKSWDWTFNDFGELTERAKKDDKLVFWLQIVGNLDDGL